MKEYALVCFSGAVLVLPNTLKRVATVSVSDDRSAVTAAFDLLTEFDDSGDLCIVWDVMEDCLVAEVHL